MENTPESFEEKAKEYFDEKKYRTIIVGKEGIKNSDDLIDAIESLADNKLSVEERDEVLRHVKASNPGNVLLKAIEAAEDNTRRARLIAACWEVDLDCTDHFMFFVKQACSDDFNVALEALTVVESIENAIGKERLDEAHKVVTDKIKQNPATIDLLNDLAAIIRDRQNS